MESKCVYCSCPFCSPKKLCELSSLKARDISASWRVCFIILLLLLGSCESGLMRVRRTAEDSIQTSENEDTNSGTIHYAQKFNGEGSEVPDCASHPSQCACEPVGKCKPCSTLDINRQLPECMVSGFKERSICSDSKRERYTSCHFHLDPREAQRFWLFEGSMLSVGVLAYAVVVFRIKKMDRLTALRIQQQINA